MRRIYGGIVTCFCVASLSSIAKAQTQPERIPSAVAEAMSMDMFGRPQYFDGIAPTSWPRALIPGGAKIVGGGLLSAGREFRMTTLIVSYSNAAGVVDALSQMITRAGYAVRDSALAAVTETQGGFAETAPRGRARGFCGDSGFVSFVAMDRTQRPNVFALTKLDGEAGRQNCTPRNTQIMMMRDMRVTLPTLTPPKGTTFFGEGSGWSGNVGNSRASLLTTLGADSILFHYRGQLVAAGWRAEGAPGIADGIAVQRFTFREKNETWSGALIIMTVDDRKQLELRYTKIP